MTGWHGEQWGFQNNEKTVEHSDNCIMTGWRMLIQQLNQGTKYK
jgi:hypothetical protein